MPAIGEQQRTYRNRLAHVAALLHRGGGRPCRCPGSRWSNGADAGAADGGGCGAAGSWGRKPGQTIREPVLPQY